MYTDACRHNMCNLDIHTFHVGSPHSLTRIFRIEIPYHELCCQAVNEARSNPRGHVQVGPDRNPVIKDLVSSEIWVQVKVKFRENELFDFILVPHSLFSPLTGPLMLSKSQSIFPFVRNLEEHVVLAGNSSCAKAVRMSNVFIQANCT